MGELKVKVTGDHQCYYFMSTKHAVW